MPRLAYTQELSVVARIYSLIPASFFIGWHTVDYRAPDDAMNPSTARRSMA